MKSTIIALVVLAMLVGVSFLGPNDAFAVCNVAQAGSNLGPVNAGSGSGAGSVTAGGFFGSPSGGDCFNNNLTVSSGLNGTNFTVIPVPTAIAQFATTINAGTLTNAARLAIPNVYVNSTSWDFIGCPGGTAVCNGTESPAQGWLMTNIATRNGQSQVANMFGYGVGPFLLGTGAAGTEPQTAPTDVTSTDQIDQLVSKYTASGSFAQNFFTVVRVNVVGQPICGTVATCASFQTIEQGDSAMGSIPGTAGVDSTTGAGVAGQTAQVFKSTEFATGGVDDGAKQLVQQDMGTGKFSSCWNCSPSNTILGPVPFISTVTNTPAPFTADTVTHPGP